MGIYIIIKMIINDSNKSFASILYIHVHVQYVCMYVCVSCSLNIRVKYMCMAKSNEEKNEKGLSSLLY
jgi:hypothetical protein